MKYLALLLFLFASLTHAEPTDHDARLTVLPGWTTPSGSQMIGLRIDLAQGWKTYWRAPGDAGIPPQVTWSGSKNIKSAAFHWPVPEIFYEGTARSIGYSETVTIPVELFAATEGPMHVIGTLDIGVCAEICVPVSLDFDLALPPSDSRDPAIVAALVNRPLTSTEARIGNVTCSVTPRVDGLRITATANIGRTEPPKAVIIETADPYVWVSEPKTTQTGSTLTASADLFQVNGDPFAIERSGVRITLLSGDQAIDIRGCVAP